MGVLVAVGGISVQEQNARPLESALDELCLEYSFPVGEVFKWSPGRDHWMRDNLIEDRRVEFFQRALALAEAHQAVAMVTIADKSRGMATGKASNHEMDVLIMAMERFDKTLGKDHGLVVVARPSGGRTDEDEFLSGCVEAVSKGTEYSQFSRLATNVLTMPFPNSRLLQVADLVVSISTALVAGHERYTAPVFPAVKTLLRGSLGRIGGAGLKIHPDYVYGNLYHWLLGDDVFWKSGQGITLPNEKRPFAQNGIEF
jgi:hypothetical protein